MSASELRSGDALLARVDRLTTQLVQRFENITALGSTEKTDRNTTVFDAFQMEVETAALVRATEDMLSLTRHLKELWLFGTLDTLGGSRDEKERERELEGDVRAVAEMLGRVLERRSAGAGEKGGGQADGTDKG